jgi:hypothetical protein
LGALRDEISRPDLFAPSRHELLQGRETETEAFLDLTKSVIDGIETKHEPAWLANVDDQTRALLEQHRLTLVISHLRGRVDELSARVICLRQEKKKEF